MTELFAARLKRLREEMGLTQEELGQAVNLSSEYISLLEAGKRTPSVIALNRISKFFQKNISYFLETRENPFDLLQADEKIPAEAKAVLTEFRKICETYLELEKTTNRLPELAPLYQTSLSPQNMAEEERRRLGLGNEPVRDIFRLCEVNGCRIIRLSLPDESRISGIFIFLEEKNAAFVLINNNLSPGKQVMAAAHLYGHYLRDREQSPIVDNFDVLEDEYVTLYSPREQFAQAFAVNFLVPQSKVREILEREIKTRRVNYPDVIFLKRYFGVSTPTILRVLRVMGYLSRSQFESYFKYDHLTEEKNIFGDISVEEFSVTKPAEKLILSERFLLLKKEAEQIEKKQEENFLNEKVTTLSQTEEEGSEESEK